MKYRRLTSEELRELEQEFIHFLAAAQITGQDWERMKQNETLAAEELIETFSDMVYEKVLGNIELLEYRDSKTLNIFKFESDKILLVGLRVNENSPIDLTQPGMFSKLDSDTIGAVSVIKTERAYKGNKQMEVFDLIQNGCVVTDEKLFDLIMNMV
jgi:hypothetical protein